MLIVQVARTAKTDRTADKSHFFILLPPFPSKLN